MFKKRGQINIMPPPGASGFSGYSGFSGKAGSGSGVPGPSGFSGFSGASGYSGAAGSSPSFPTGNVEIGGSLSTGVNSGATGDIAFLGSNSGAVHLRANGDAGTGILLLPSTIGVHTLATLADINALRSELGLPPIGG